MTHQVAAVLQKSGRLKPRLTFSTQSYYPVGCDGGGGGGDGGGGGGGGVLQSNEAESTN